MEDLPDDVRDSIARGVAAYVRAVPRLELPNSLRPLQAFRPKAMLGRRGALLQAIDDEGLRDQILKWLDEVKPDLSEADEMRLRIACERSDGWIERLAESATSESADDQPPLGQERAELQRALERERERASRARAAAKRARTETAAGLEALRKEAADLQRRLASLLDELNRERAARAAAEERRAGAEEERAKEVRRAERNARSASEARTAAEREARAARREAVGARRELERAGRQIEALEAEVERLKARLEVHPSEDRPSRSPRRKPLKVSRGRFEDDPQTLDEWLSHDGVVLLVDGYNVAKAEGGFGELELELQRDRLVDGLVRLVGRKKVDATVVFDGSEVAPAARRAFRGPVKVEYSRPAETADDHLVALLEQLPPDPVVVATNDRELQDRLRELGATIATSDQLLALLR